MGCLFCNIQSNLHQTNFNVRIVGKHCLSIEDQFPVSKGHHLIIPHRRVNSIWELTDEELMDVFTVMVETKNWIVDIYNPDGFNIGINQGDAAGQTIPHLHIHIIPRYRGDVANPKGGVRGVIPWKQEYVPLFTGDEETEDDPYGVLGALEARRWKM